MGHRESAGKPDEHDDPGQAGPDLQKPVQPSRGRIIAGQKTEQKDGAEKDQGDPEISPVALFMGSMGSLFHRRFFHGPTRMLSQVLLIHPGDFTSTFQDHHVPPDPLHLPEAHFADFFSPAQLPESMLFMKLDAGYVFRKDPAL